MTIKIAPAGVAQVTTWANGYGNWTARVSIHPGTVRAGVAARRAAIGAIYAELLERGAVTADYKPTVIPVEHAYLEGETGFTIYQYTEEF